jgi:hypothetical protein
MGHLERGEKNVSLKSLVRVSDALEITISDLLHGVSGGEKDEAKSHPGAERQIDHERLMREVLRLEQTVAAVRQIVAPESAAVRSKRKAKP